MLVHRRAMRKSSQSTQDPFTYIPSSAHASSSAVASRSQTSGLQTLNRVEALIERRLSEILDDNSPSNNEENVQGDIRIEQREFTEAERLELERRVNEDDNAAVNSELQRYLDADIMKNPEGFNILRYWQVCAIAL